jgi:hypothetical protein
LRVLLAVALILGFALAGAVLANRVDTRQPALVTARAVSAGQVITDADLRVVPVAADAGVATVPDTGRGSVVGRTARVPLTAGTLLSPAHLGAPDWPPVGQAVAAVAVKPGRLPSGLTAGSRVIVLVLPTANAAGGGAGAQVVQAQATVVSVQTGGDLSEDTGVSLLLAATDATRVASVAGDVTLIQLGAGR